MTARTIEWEHDPEVTPRTIRSGSEADTLLRWDEVGRPLPKRLKAAVETWVFLATSARPQASARLSAATIAIATLQKDDQRAVADAILRAAQRAEAIKLPADKLPALEAEAREAERLDRGIGVAEKVAYSEMVAEVREAGFNGLGLPEVWSDLTAYAPTDSVRENRAFEVFSAEVFGLCEALTLILEGGRDLAQEERKRLSRLFGQRPKALPRLSDVHAEMRGEREATPKAKSVAAAETAALAKKVEDRKLAQAAARARRGGDGTTGPQNTTTN